jgi:hypothetical protein
MSKKAKQLDFIRKKLLSKGSISRNYCIENRILRLASRIFELRDSGMKITGKEINGDFIYTLKK